MIVNLSGLFGRSKFNNFMLLYLKRLRLILVAKVASHFVGKRVEA
jgi:hypothetical protein